MAARLILERRLLLLWSLLPIGVTLVLYYYGISYLIDQAQALLSAWFIDWGLEPGGWVLWSLDLMTSLVLMLIAAVTFAFTSSIVASPFNDLLAERCERYAEPPLSPVERTSLRGQARLIWIDLGKAMAAGGMSLVALLVCWVPVLNLGVFALAFGLVSFQFLSYPQTRRGLGIADGLRFLWRHSWSCTGFGATLSFLFALPFLSSFALPLAVVGGTLLAARAPGGRDLAPLR